MGTDILLYLISIYFVDKQLLAYTARTYYYYYYYYYTYTKCQKNMQGLLLGIAIERKEVKSVEHPAYLILFIFQSRTDFGFLGS